MAFQNGGDKGSRTPDLLNAIETLYQLSYIPKNKTAHRIPKRALGRKRFFVEFCACIDVRVLVSSVSEIHQVFSGFPDGTLNLCKRRMFFLGEVNERPRLVIIGSSVDEVARLEAEPTERSEVSARDFLKHPLAGCG